MKPAAPASASAPISVSSAPSWPFVIAARKPTGTCASVCGPRAQAAQDVGVVDDRLGVRHREDRAVAAGRGRRRARSRSSPRPRGPACADARAGRRTPARARSPAAVDDAVLVRVELARRSARSRRCRCGRRASRRLPRPGRGRARRGSTTSSRRCGRRASRDPHCRLDGDRARSSAGRRAPPSGRSARNAPGRRSSARVGIGDARVDLDAAVHRAWVHDTLARRERARA